jgi:hypothetical protein
VVERQGRQERDVNLGVQREDDLARDGAVGEGVEGGADVVEGEGAVDQDAECAVGECGEDELESLAGLLGGDAEAAVAEQADAPAVDRPEVDGDFCAGADPEHDVATVLSEQAERGRGEVAAEGVDDDCRPYLRGGVGEPDTWAPRPAARLMMGSPTPPPAPRTSTRSSAVMSARSTTP